MMKDQRLRIRQAMIGVWRTGASGKQERLISVQQNGLLPKVNWNMLACTLSFFIPMQLLTNGLLEQLLSFWIMLLMRLIMGQLL